MYRATEFVRYKITMRDGEDGKNRQEQPVEGLTISNNTQSPLLISISRCVFFKEHIEHINHASYLFQSLSCQMLGGKTMILGSALLTFLHGLCTPPSSKVSCTSRIPRNSLYQSWFGCIQLTSRLPFHKTFEASLNRRKTNSKQFGASGRLRLKTR